MILASALTDRSSQNSSSLQFNIFIAVFVLMILYLHPQILLVLCKLHVRNCHSLTVNSLDNDYIHTWAQLINTPIFTRELAG